MMTFILLASQLVGCATFKPTEMIEAINQGESVVLEVAEPTYDIQIKGEQVQEVTWIQLDQLKTFNTGFRQSFDKAFNITIVSENGMSGKSGCLFVNEVGERDGNTTLQSAFRNKSFVTKYWSDSAIQNALIKSASSAYTDISNDNDALYASINAYYNLLNDAKNPDSFNATQSLSREQFYTLMFKSLNPVSDISASEDFSNAVGSETEYTKYAEQVADKGFLQSSNKSLDSSNISGNITRAEAVYMVVNELFPDELSKVTDKDKAFSDTKNSGDLALKCGFKELIKVDGQKEKNLVEKDKWQAYSLAYSLQNPDKGIQDDLYKTLVVANQLSLLDGTESRWDETISKKEALEFLSKAFLKQNELYGYLSEVEHGTINPNNFAADTSTDNLEEKVGVDSVTGIEHGTDDQGRPVAENEESVKADKIIEELLNPSSSAVSEDFDINDHLDENGNYVFDKNASSSQASQPASSGPSSGAPASSTSSKPTWDGYIPGASEGYVPGQGGGVRDDIEGGSTTDGGTKWN